MTRTKKRKLKKNRIILALVIVVAIVALGGFGIYQVFMKGDKTKQVSKVTDKVSNGYDYSITDSATKYSKELFKKLKKELSKDVPNEKKYAELESQLFLSEFFTLSNKVNRNDVGGVQFVASTAQESFTKEAMEGIYHYVKNNIYGDREQELPEVVNVDVINVTQKEYTLSDEKTDSKAYYIDLTINYEKDLGYQKSCTLVLIHNGKKLEVAKMTEK